MTVRFDCLLGPVVCAMESEFGGGGGEELAASSLLTVLKHSIDGLFFSEPST